MNRFPAVIVPKPQLQRQRGAGYIERYPTGQITYLAPLPFPTHVPPDCPEVGELNDVYLDFGMGLPRVFLWQFILGSPLVFFLFIAYLMPLLLGAIGFMVGHSGADTWDIVRGTHNVGIGYGVGISLFVLTLSLVVWLYVHNKYAEIPTRFNRQRREICFVPTDETEPVIVPWESISAWVVQAQGANKYGVKRHYGMGLGFYHEARGVSFTQEFVCFGLSTAISHWEAIRAYMEYEVHTLKEITDPLDLQGLDDPPHEGLHTFRNARARLHQQIHDKQRGWVYGFFWYLYHVMTLWTIPHRLTEWETGRVKRMGRKALPEAMREWSEPLPKEQWAKPSAELLRMTAQVNSLCKRHPHVPITEIFAQVHGGAGAGK